jgi:hypothetical protein
MKEKVRALAEAEWKKSRPEFKALKNANWNLRLTPPLPSEWMKAGLPVTVYAYSAGIELESIGRYETIAKPWAKMEFVFGAPGSLKFTRLPGGETLLGHQGVRPLTAKESEIYKRDIYDSYAALAAPGGRPAGLEPEILAYYKLWRDTNGVIAEPVLKMHAGIAAKLIENRGK